MEKINELAEEHWEWLKSFIESLDIAEIGIKTVEYAYKSAFIHGAKHFNKEKIVMDEPLNNDQWISWALKIANIQKDSDGSALLISEDKRYNAIYANHAYMQKHNPQPGGYYVVYKDGYKSWSPAEAFENGYTKINRINHTEDNNHGRTTK